MQTYTIVFSKEDWQSPGPEYRTITIKAAGHNHMVAQVRELVAPAGYHYIGTRDDNQWHHPPIRRA